MIHKQESSSIKQQLMDIHFQGDSFQDKGVTEEIDINNSQSIQILSNRQLQILLSPKNDSFRDSLYKGQFVKSSEAAEKTERRPEKKWQQSKDESNDKSSKNKCDSISRYGSSKKLKADNSNKDLSSTLNAGYWKQFKVQEDAKEVGKYSTRYLVARDPTSQKESLQKMKIVEDEKVDSIRALPEKNYEEQLKIEDSAERKSNFINHKIDSQTKPEDRLRFGIRKSENEEIQISLSQANSQDERRHTNFNSSQKQLKQISVKVVTNHELHSKYLQIANQNAAKPSYHQEEEFAILVQNSNNGLEVEPSLINTFDPSLKKNLEKHYLALQKFRIDRDPQVYFSQIETAFLTKSINPMARDPTALGQRKLQMEMQRANQETGIGKLEMCHLGPSNGKRDQNVQSDNEQLDDLDQFVDKHLSSSQMTKFLPQPELLAENFISQQQINGIDVAQPRKKKNGLMRRSLGKTDKLKKHLLIKGQSVLTQELPTRIRKDSPDFVPKRISQGSFNQGIKTNSDTGGLVTLMLSNMNFMPQKSKSGNSQISPSFKTKSGIAGRDLRGILSRSGLEKDERKPVIDISKLQRKKFIHSGKSTASLLERKSTKKNDSRQREETEEQTSQPYLSPQGSPQMLNSGKSKGPFGTPLQTPLGVATDYTRQMLPSKIVVGSSTTVAQNKPQMQKLSTSPNWIQSKRQSREGVIQHLNNNLGTFNSSQGIDPLSMERDLPQGSSFEDRRCRSNVVVKRFPARDPKKVQKGKALYPAGPSSKWSFKHQNTMSSKFDEDKGDPVPLEYKPMPHLQNQLNSLSQLSGEMKVSGENLLEDEVNSAYSNNKKVTRHLQIAEKQMDKKEGSPKAATTLQNNSVMNTSSMQNNSSVSPNQARNTALSQVISAEALRKGRESKTREIGRRKSRGLEVKEYPRAISGFYCLHINKGRPEKELKIGDQDRGSIHSKKSLSQLEGRGELSLNHRGLMGPKMLKMNQKYFSGSMKSLHEAEDKLDRTRNEQVDKFDYHMSYDIRQKTQQNSRDTACYFLPQKLVNMDVELAGSNSNQLSGHKPNEESTHSKEPVPKPQLADEDNAYAPSATFYSLKPGFNPKRFPTRKPFISSSQKSRLHIKEQVSVLSSKAIRATQIKPKQNAKEYGKETLNILQKQVQVEKIQVGNEEYKSRNSELGQSTVRNNTAIFNQNSTNLSTHRNQQRHSFSKNSTHFLKSNLISPSAIQTSVNLLSGQFINSSNMNATPQAQKNIDEMFLQEHDHKDSEKKDAEMMQQIKEMESDYFQIQQSKRKKFTKRITEESIPNPETRLKQKYTTYRDQQIQERTEKSIEGETEQSEQQAKSISQLLKERPIVIPQGSAEVRSSSNQQSDLKEQYNLRNAKNTNNIRQNNRNVVTTFKATPSERETEEKQNLDICSQNTSQLPDVASRNQQGVIGKLSYPGKDTATDVISTQFAQNSVILPQESQEKRDEIQQSPLVSRISDQGHILHFNRRFHQVLDRTYVELSRKQYVRFSPKQRDKTQELIQLQQKRFKSQQNKKYQREKEKAGRLFDKTVFNQSQEKINLKKQPNGLVKRLMLPLLKSQNQLRDEKKSAGYPHQTSESSEPNQQLMNDMTCQYGQTTPHVQSKLIGAGEMEKNSEVEKVSKLTKTSKMSNRMCDEMELPSCYPKQSEIIVEISQHHPSNRPSDAFESSKVSNPYNQINAFDVQSQIKNSLIPEDGTHRLVIPPMHKRKHKKGYAKVIKTVKEFKQSHKQLKGDAEIFQRYQMNWSMLQHQSVIGQTQNTSVLTAHNELGNSQWLNLQSSDFKV